MLPDQSTSEKDGTVSIVNAAGRVKLVFPDFDRFLRSFHRGNTTGT
jgi:hypothetical protein